MSLLSFFEGALHVNGVDEKVEPGPPGPAAPTDAPPEVVILEARKQKPPPDHYLTRLVKLVPSEVVALYLAFKEVAATWLGVWAAICFVLVLFVRTVGTKKQGKPVQWPAVGIAIVSYVLWIYAIGDHILSWSIPTDWPGGIVSVSVGVWTFVLPYFYTGD